MPPIRAFFAIDLPENTQRSIARIMKELQNQHQKERIHWSKLENLHITLQFLAALQINDVERLIQYVHSTISSIPAFDLMLGTLELFPRKHHPRVISIHIPEQDLLTQLAKKIGEAITKMGYETETRPFRGHLTLARFNNVEKEFTLAEISYPAIEKFQVREVILYQSKPLRGGSEYTPLARVPLKIIDDRSSSA